MPCKATSTPTMVGKFFTKADWSLIFQRRRMFENHWERERVHGHNLISFELGFLNNVSGHFQPKSVAEKRALIIAWQERKLAVIRLMNLS
ncbi:hypothetical protein TWF506_006911 [Arthrobotrys conoides]|uniref:Uncharacterized protein n=1 Tax=Arthrobotrys conoides TaxID=74498 RepID=A0AAN8PMN1_9PEZI